MLSLILAFFVSCISESVFICTGTTAEVYHKSDNCRGLNRCGGDVKRISLKKAEELHRRPCRICFDDENSLSYAENGGYPSTQVGDVRSLLGLFSPMVK